MKKGFTLIELIVVVAIIALISSLTIANFPSFRGRLSVDRETSKVGLALRKAQQYSTGVRRFAETFNTNPAPSSCTKGLYEAQFPVYGLTVSVNNPKEYDIYADPDCDRRSGSYASGSYTDLIEEVSLEGGVSIYDLCTDVDSGETCGKTQIDIWYIRPSPTLFLTIDGVPDVSGLHQSVKIKIKGVDGSKKSVIIRKTGQISVQNEP